MPSALGLDLWLAWLCRLCLRERGLLLCSPPQHLPKVPVLPPGELQGACPWLPPVPIPPLPWVFCVGRLWPDRLVVFVKVNSASFQGRCWAPGCRWAPGRTPRGDPPAALESGAKEPRCVVSMPLPLQLSLTGPHQNPKAHLSSRSRPAPGELLGDVRPGGGCRSPALTASGFPSAALPSLLSSPWTLASNCISKPPFTPFFLLDREHLLMPHLKVTALHLPPAPVLLKIFIFY